MTTEARRNCCRNPFAIEIAPGLANGFAMYSSGTGETGINTFLTGQSDGPVLSSGEKITSYARRSITVAKTGNSTGWTANGGTYRAVNPGVAGESRRAGVWLRYISLDGSPLKGRMRTSLFTNTGSAVNSFDWPYTTLESGVWTFVETTVTAIGDFESVGWWFYHVSSDIPASGSTFDATGCIIGDGEPFSGSSPNTSDWTYTWAGPVNNSASIESPTPGLRVQGFTDAPCPRVGITLDGLDTTGPSRVTLWRSTPGGQRRKVRGWDKRIVYGSDYAIDYEAPLGRPVRYDLVVDTGAIVPLRVSDTITLDTDTGFIQDPLQPLGAIALAGNRDGDTTTLMAPAFKALEYALEGSTVAIMGSREPVALTGQRLIAAGIDFSMVTRAAEQGTHLRNLFLDTPIVLIRPLPEWGDLPDLIYTAPSVTEKQVDTSIGGERIAWSITGDSVRPPSINVLVALWTYDQVAALWTTYASAQSAASASAARYLDVQRDPTMGV